MDTDIMAKGDDFTLPLSVPHGRRGFFAPGAGLQHPAQAAEIVVQRLIDAGFQIKPAERCAP